MWCTTKICVGTNLFNIYSNNLFSLLNEIDDRNFADETTPSVCHKNHVGLLEKLERNS